MSGLLAGLLVAYLALFPFYPELAYRFSGGADDSVSSGLMAGTSQDPGIAASSSLPNQPTTDQVAPAANLPETGYAVSENRLIIPKIKVNTPIVAGENEAAAMNKGAWLMPQGIRPDESFGNIIITGHRFKYLPPNNTTFYLFHKLVPGDRVKIVWDGVEYGYVIAGTKVVEKTDLTILDPTPDKTLTLFTCDPIFSQANRLVIIAKPAD